jgi:hypothetical protein
MRAATFALLVHLVGLPAHAQTLDDVMFLASQRMVEYQRTFASVAADESATQEIFGPKGELKRTRTLDAEYALVFAPELDLWRDFRDVTGVDGKPVRTPDGRLQKVLSAASPGDVGEARKISRDSTRHNLGDSRVGVSAPTLALLFLTPFNQYRLYFEKTAEETLDGTPVWVIGYTEHSRPTLLGGGAGEIFARGSFWIDPRTGDVLKSQLSLGDLNSASRSTYEVTFKPATGFTVLVPAEMREEHDNPRSPRADRATRRTTYSNFRRFEVAAEAALRSRD